MSLVTTSLLSAAGQPGCSRSSHSPLLASGILLALAEPPLAAPALAKLRDPARRELELVGRLLGGVAQREEVGQLTVALGKAAEELGPVNTKGSSIGRRRDRVVLEALFVDVEVLL